MPPPRKYETPRNPRCRPPGWRGPPARRPLHAPWASQPGVQMGANTGERPRDMEPVLQGRPSWGCLTTLPMVDDPERRTSFNARTCSSPRTIGENPVELSGPVSARQGEEGAARPGAGGRWSARPLWSKLAASSKAENAQASRPATPGPGCTRARAAVWKGVY